MNVRVRMLLVAMWVWACIALAVSRLVTFVLTQIVRVVPDFAVCSAPLAPPPVEIVRAMAKQGDRWTNVTNRIRLFAGATYTEIDGHPSVDFNHLAKTLDWAMLWICYMCVDKKDLRKTVMVIDFTRKVIQRMHDGGPLQSEDAVFGHYAF
jgi:hypothetical protein